jgi:hypothetical protein
MVSEDPSKNDGMGTGGGGDTHTNGAGANSGQIALLSDPVDVIIDKLLR